MYESSYHYLLMSNHLSCLLYTSDTNVEIINIGDSVRARRIIDGVQEGHNILNVLADHEYL